MGEYRAAPHMTRFRCLGSECEDTCCKTWEVPITDEDRERLARGIGEEGASGMVHRISDGRNGTVVVLKKLDNGRCSKLDDNQLCTLHATYGEAVLPTVCHNYPRDVRRVGTQLELTGRLSCPEVARLALLADEPTLAEAPRDAFDRLKVRNEVSPEDDAPYLVPFREMRDALIALCVTPGFTVASRLYFIAHLATRIGGFYHREIETLDRERLMMELESIQRPEVQAELHQRRGTSSPMEGLAIELAQGLMYSRVATDKEFEPLARKAAATHAQAAGVPEQADLLKQLAEIGRMQTWQTHQQRRAALGPENNARLDAMLARYCKSYWLRDWYTLSPNLMEHTMLLVIRVTLIRFLLVAHPNMRPDVDDATRDKAAIEVFYMVSRAYDHISSLRGALANMLQTRGMLTIEHAGALLKL